MEEINGIQTLTLVGHDAKASGCLLEVCLPRVDTFTDAMKNPRMHTALQTHSDDGTGGNPADDVDDADGGDKLRETIFCRWAWGFSAIYSGGGVKK